MKTKLIIAAAVLLPAVAIAFYLLLNPSGGTSGQSKEIGHISTISKGSQQVHFSGLRRTNGWNLRFDAQTSESQFEQCRIQITIRRSKLSDVGRASGMYADDDTRLFAGTLIDLTRRDRPWSVPSFHFPENRLTCTFDIQFDTPVTIPCDIRVVAYSSDEK